METESYLAYTTIFLAGLVIGYFGRWLEDKFTKFNDGEIK